MTFSHLNDFKTQNVTSSDSDVDDNLILVISNLSPKYRLQHPSPIKMYFQLYETTNKLFTITTYWFIDQLSTTTNTILHLIQI